MNTINLCIAIAVTIALLLEVGLMMIYDRLNTVVSFLVFFLLKGEKLDEIQNKGLPE